MVSSYQSFNFKYILREIPWHTQAGRWVDTYSFTPLGTLVEDAMLFSRVCLMVCGGLSRRSGAQTLCYHKEQDHS